MKLKQQAAQRTAKLAVASLVLLVSLHCNVYDSSLLGTLESSGGTGARVSHAGASGSTGGRNAAAGSAGEPEPGSGSAGAGFGGLLGMAGEVDTGGADANGGSAGNEEGMAGVAGVLGGSGGAVGGSAGAVGGRAGSGGSGGSAGAPVQTATGCAKLSVPLDATTDKAHFVITLTSAADFSGATISMRVYVQAGQGGTIFNYVQDSGTFHFLGMAEGKRPLLASSSGWSTISWNVGAEPDAAGTGIVKTSIKNIGIEINAQPSATWSNPTIVYVDSISVATPTLSFTLDAAASVYTTPTTSSASGQAMWLNSGTSDTTATNVSVSWQATCP